MAEAGLSVKTGSPGLGPLFLIRAELSIDLVPESARHPGNTEEQ